MDEPIKVATNIIVVESLSFIDRLVLVRIGPIFTQIIDFACLIVGADSEVCGGLIKFVEVKGDERERIGPVFVFRMAVVKNGVVRRGV